MTTSTNTSTTTRTTTRRPTADRQEADREQAALARLQTAVIAMRTWRQFAAPHQPVRPALAGPRLPAAGPGSAERR